jgi:hypothetical protein
MKRFFLLASISMLLFWGHAYAGTFVSGSTGADGAFAPTADITLQLPANGIFNFTTVNIPGGVTVKFQRNAANTPVYILATGDVTIAGTVDVSGENGMDGNTGSTGPIYGGKGGPGGFDGGSGGEPASTGVSAKAPGTGLGSGGSIGGDSTCLYYSGICYSYMLPGQAGSHSSMGTFISQPIDLDKKTYGAGSIYGTPVLMPLIGGSGGGGGLYGSLTQYGGGGGGGGGAILIASSTKVNITGTIKANGGKGGYGEYIKAVYSYSTRNVGGSGSGGGIKLIANQITISGSISANGSNTNSGTNSNTTGGDGRIRIEANNYSQTGSVSPGPSVTTPGLVFIPQSPTLAITKIAGNSVPASASGSYATPDITLPATTVNPISIEISATKIPVGTSVKITAVPQNGSSSSTTAALAGTDTSSTAAASLTISTTSPSVITAETTFTIQTAMFYDGEKIEKVRVAANMGKQSEVTYITETGKEIPAALLTAKVMK